MRVLLLAHAFNSLTQRLFVALTERGHTVSVEFDVNDAVTEEAVALFRPDVVVAPFLKRAIPEAVWRNVACLVVHPGIVGDRGPSALDWAVLEGEREWGVTVLQADAEMDAGDIWDARTFPMRDATKSSLYRNEVGDAAEAGVLAALDRLDRGLRPSPLDPARDRWRPATTQADRAIDWGADETATVLRKIASGDGRPGVRDEVLGLPVWLFDAHAEDRLTGAPGVVVGRRDGAICRATVDGAVWIGHLRPRIDGEPTFKRPAEAVLAGRLGEVPAVPAHEGRTYREVWVERRGVVAVLHFPFYNGAMSTGRCVRLRAAFARARAGARVVVLAGGPDFWSNGMDLNQIEAADSPADESWRNINAIDDFVLDVVTSDDVVTIAAMQGNAGAGGVFAALAADRVVARGGVVLNPHYKGMGNLYGSEYWTYLLPRRAGAGNAEAIAAARLPMGVDEAVRVGLVDERIDGGAEAFLAAVVERAEAIAADPAFDALVADKARRRAADEAERPLAAYRADELARMRLNFYGFDPSYHVARWNFVRAVPKSRTPLVIARHRRRAARAAAEG